MKKILIWIDNSDISSKVVKTGISLGKNINAQISLIYVIDNKLRSEAEYKVEEMRARNLLQDLLTMFNCSAIIYIEQGIAEQKLLEKAKILNVDMMVAGIEIRKGAPNNITELLSEIPILLVPFKDNELSGLKHKKTIINHA